MICVFYVWKKVDLYKYDKSIYWNNLLIIAVATVTTRVYTQNLISKSAQIHTAKTSNVSTASAPKHTFQVLIGYLET